MSDTLPVIQDIGTIRQIYGNVLTSKQGTKGTGLVTSVKDSLKIMDEQDAINSVQWYNLPKSLDANLIERILYYRGQGALFYYEVLDRFFFLPYVGVDLDVYGRYVGINPMPFNGSDTRQKKTKSMFDGLAFACQYDIILPEDLEVKHLTGSAVILHDYSIALPQKIQPRANLQEPLLNMMAEILPFIRTGLMNGTGIEGVRVQSSDEAYSVQQASNALTRAAIVGDRWVPIEAGLQSEVLNHGGQTTMTDYLMTLQSLDNIRLSMHGLENGGIFEKKAHMLESEAMMNMGTSSMVMADKIYQRQHFCNIVNSIWGLGIWCEPSEVASGADQDGDGNVKNQAPDQSTEQDNQSDQEE